MPTPLNMRDCLKVYRVFKGTRCSVRCAQTCEALLLLTRAHSDMRTARTHAKCTYEQFMPTPLSMLDCLKVYRVSARTHAKCTYEQFMPTPLNMIDCLKVYRVFKGTCCSVRCACAPLVKKTAVKDCLEGPLGPSVFPNAST